MKYFVQVKFREFQI